MDNKIIEDKVSRREYENICFNYDELCGRVDGFLKEIERLKKQPEQIIKEIKKRATVASGIFASAEEVATFKLILDEILKKYQEKNNG